MRDIRIVSGRATKKSKSSELLMKDLRRIPVMTAERERELGEMLKRTGEIRQRAIDELVCGNLRFVLSVAKQSLGQGLALEDLFCEGVIGLIGAAEKFDVDKGARFTSYAVWSIRDKIHKALASVGGLIKRPEKMDKADLKYEQWCDKKEQELLYRPSVFDYAEETGVGKDEILAIQTPRQFESLDLEMLNSEDCFLEDQIDSGKYADDDVSLETLVNRLKPLLQKIVGVYEAEFLMDMMGLGIYDTTVCGIADKYGVTKRHTWRKMNNILRTIKESEYADEIKSILEDINELK